MLDDFLVFLRSEKREGKGKIIETWILKKTWHPSFEFMSDISFSWSVIGFKTLTSRVKFSGSRRLSSSNWVHPTEYSSWFFLIFDIFYNYVELKSIHSMKRLVQLMDDWLFPWYDWGNPNMSCYLFWVPSFGFQKTYVRPYHYC